MSRFLALVSLAISLALVIGCANSDYSQTERGVGSSSATGGKKKSKSVLALGGKCPVCLVEMGKTVVGREQYSSVYDGYKYLFPAEKQKKMFDANPAKYAVQDHGNCVVCKVEMNKTVKGDPKIYALHNKKIYLFVGDKQKKMFTSNPKKYTGETIKNVASGTARKSGRGVTSLSAEGKKLALGGNCPVCLVAGKTVPGKKEYSSVYDGYKYLFPAEKQKKMFDANPAKYAVQDHGNCVVCKVEMNKTVKGDPKIYALYNGKIYLFVGDKQKKMFTSNPKKYTGEAKMLESVGSGTTRE